MPAKCKNRERLLQSSSDDVNDVPGLPLAAVRGILCFRCFDSSDKLLKCGGCRRAFYCSQECQKLDWKAVHKQQCKILQNINELELEDYSESRTWTEYRQSQLKYLRIINSRTELRDTRFIIQAQPYCSTCRRSANQLASKSIALKACPDCHLLHHCSGCPDSHSKAVCASYQYQNTFEQFRHQIFEETGKTFVIVCTNDPSTAYKPLAESTGWYDYFVNISDKDFIKGKVTEDFTRVSDSVQSMSPEMRDFEENRHLFLSLATDSLTMPLTIISALEDLSLLHHPSLKIHLLGATLREFLSMSCFEEILHLIPTLTSLHITGIGPSSVQFGSSTDPYSPPVTLPSCPTCTSQSRTRTLASFKGLYHTFTTHPLYPGAPDLIVAFNSGFVDGDDAETAWDKTIRDIAASSVPALFTTYNAHEARNEEAKLTRLGANMLVPPERNKWRSMVPMPELLDCEFDMWAQNQWRYVIGGKRA